MFRCQGPTVHVQPVAKNGQTVIAELNGSITIKRFVRKGNSIELTAQPSFGSCWVISKFKAPALEEDGGFELVR